MPRVSVFIPSYNHAPYIGAAIRSVQAQTFQDFEIVVTDDGSTDGTAEIAAALEEPRLRLKRLPENKGAATATNDAIRRSRGEYLALLNSDDAFEPQKLERQVACLDANPEVGAVFAWPNFMNHDGAPIHPDQALNGHLFDVENRSQADWLRHFFFNGNCLCHPTLMIRRECYERMGLYDPRFAALPDLHMWIRLLAAYPIHVMPERLIRFRHLPNGANASSLRVDNYLRFTWENPQVLRLYATLPVDLLGTIFGPEIMALQLDLAQDPKALLGRICIATANPTLNRLGLDLLFDAMSPDETHARPSDGFGYVEFHRYGTGAKDVFNVVAQARVARLERDLRVAQGQPS